MEIVVIVVIIIIVVIFLVGRASHSSASEEIAHRLHELSMEIRDLRKQIEKLSAPLNTAPAAPPKPPATIKPVSNESVVDERARPFAEETTSPKPVAPEKSSPVFEAPTQKPVLQPALLPRKESWFNTWLKNNPDIEKFIGENLINKIGIAVLVLGIAFFVKYAIDQDWINEAGRVAIGLACGGLLVVLAHRLRINYRSFSSVLVGGGLTVFYFTIAFAFHQYHLIGQLSAFLIMTVITAFAVLLSVLYNRIELAILATIGGFITPFLVSTGSNNYIALFTYLAILNTGLIVLAYFKKWMSINFIAFIFTTLIFGGWMLNTVLLENTLPYKDGLLFASLFYVLFLVMQLANHIKQPQQFNRYDFSLLLAINAAYYTGGMVLLSYWNNGEWQGLFTAVLAIVNCFLAWLFYKKEKFDRNFVYLLIGLTLTFVSLIAPIQLSGNYITLFWAAECVLLFWFYQQSGILLPKIAALAIAVLAIVSVMLDWAQVYSNSSIELPIVFNKAFTTGFALAIAFSVYYRLLHKEANTYYYKKLPVLWIRSGLITGTVAILLFSGLLEINHQFLNRYPKTGFHFVYLQVYVIGFFTVAFSVLKAMRIKTDAFLRLVIPLIVFVLYLFNRNNCYEVERAALVSGANKILFAGHWFGIIFLLLLAASTIHYFRNNYSSLQKVQNSFTWIMVCAIVTVLSIEFRNLYTWFSYSGPGSFPYAENLFHKTGLTVLWGLSSFTLIWLGLKFKFKPLRVIALVLFGTTLVKLFTYDIRNIPPGGKIVAFILLGIVLLTVSFMYQRLKKILIDDNLEKS